MTTHRMTQRYTRLVEYTEIINSLLASNAPVSFDGEYYKMINLKLSPQLPDEMEPGYFCPDHPMQGWRLRERSMRLRSCTLNLSMNISNHILI